MNVDNLKAATPIDVVSLHRVNSTETLLVTANLLTTFGGYKLLESVCTIDSGKRPMMYRHEKRECCEMLGLKDTSIRVHSVSGRAVGSDATLKWQGLDVAIPVSTVEVGLVFELPLDAVDSFVLASWVCKEYIGESNHPA